jgi:hypothetical protein
MLKPWQHPPTETSAIKSEPVTDTERAMQHLCTALCCKALRSLKGHSPLASQDYHFVTEHREHCSQTGN